MSASEIELHVGHYGDGTGANGYVDEVKYARKFIKRIYNILISNGVPSTYFEDSTSKNQTQNINNLIKHHNADKNGFIVSGHLNSSSTKTDSAIGVEVLYYSEKSVAQNVVEAIVKVSGLKNRGVKQRTDLGVLAKTYEPAILIEFGFVNSKKDVELLDKHYEEICQVVARVLASHIGYSINVKPKEAGEKNSAYSSSALQAETELTLSSKARLTMIVEAAIAAGANDSWRRKHENREMTEEDYKGLALKAIIDPQLKK